MLEDFGPEVDPELVHHIIELADGASALEGVEINVGGPTVMFAEMEKPGKREGAGVAVALLILLATFGSVVAAGLPIAVALFGLGAGMSLVLLATRIFEVSTFAPAMAAMIGLGVGIDYALFIVTRYREGLGRALDPEDATALALQTSGRAVIFAGATVVISMLGMVLAGVSMLVGLAVSAALTVACTVVAAITLLPAVLGFAGTSIDRLSLQRSRSASADDVEASWHRWSRMVQRRPWPFCVGSLVILLGLSVPVLSMDLGGPQFGGGPTTHSSRRAYDLVTEGFGEGLNGPLVLVANLDPDQPQQRDALARLAEPLGRTPGVLIAAPPVVNAAGDTAVIAVVPTSAPNSQDTEDLVDRLRQDVIPTAMEGSGVHVGVSGVTALFVDMAELLNRRLPMFIGSVLALSFLLLLVVFRSVLVPLKAALLNLLSIGAAYGVVVAVFQWGWGKDLIGVARPGPVMAFIPMMLFAILFGLSMDYEVFLLSRVREEYDRSGDNATAVADGLAATARVITAAAAIMVTIFLSFVLGDDPIIKTFGLGLAIAVFIDATIVRMVLVPATMELLGDANWWFPSWLERWTPNVTLESGGPATLTTGSQPLLAPPLAEWLRSLPAVDRGHVAFALDRRLFAADLDDGPMSLPAGRRSRQLRLVRENDGTAVLSFVRRSRSTGTALPWREVRDQVLDPAAHAAYDRLAAASRLGEHVTRLRRQQLLSIDELAVRAGTTHDAIAAVELGLPGAELDVLVRVGQALGARLELAAGGSAVRTATMRAREQLLGIRRPLRRPAHHGRPRPPARPH
jgi:RND superfamily putative drug exporter